MSSMEMCTFIQCCQLWVILAKLFSKTICTVWKLHCFSFTQILHELNIGDSRCAKSAILTHSEALNFEFYEFLHFLKAKMYQKTKFRAPKVAKTAALELLDSAKKIFTQNSSDRKILKFPHHVSFTV